MAVHVVHGVAPLGCRPDDRVLLRGPVRGGYRAAGPGHGPQSHRPHGVGVGKAAVGDDPDDGDLRSVRVVAPWWAITTAIDRGQLARVLMVAMATFL